MTVGVLCFLVNPQQVNQIKIMSWNINSVRTKMEKLNVRQLMANYDVIGINAVKI